MILIDGKKTSAEVKADIKQEVEAFKAKGGKTPHLAAILVGNDGASETYVASKVRSCNEVGFDSTLERMGKETTEEELLAKIDEFNKNKDIDGFIVQLPLPSHINEQKVTTAILPEKDVDGFHPVNVGRMALGQPAYISATPYGIIQMLEKYDIDTTGKHCVVIGRSNIVGSPMSILMAKNSKYANCTVTLTHSRTKNLQEYTKSADIVIVALGKPGFLTGEMIKEGATVVDVGITRVPDESKKSGFRIQGDADFESCAEKASYITPVPGGVGLMTVASLMKNTLAAAKKEIYA
ncbi:MAG: bifunctional 5,10-methylene-tetrahydrofolate dehydrogenase/5,10-methylene-tetrahydrofolate cyclohydrolase [Flavobacteriales bacterium]|mgnify:CR=1 FL=1|nr:bifunctional 5,10-methylene-tetrahydrofolate dehydrogenase/5,10-methylene-tetrahydrofolate cyclohydrolase [Flavobacteriales bacterium]|tara:strand:- start:14097 stop:14978 length:882 start_codon:yes stop_codon:yes gene_type:complete